MPLTPEFPITLPPLRFNLAELAGSLGDFGTIIPLILAVAYSLDRIKKKSAQEKQ